MNSIVRILSSARALRPLYVAIVLAAVAGSVLQLVTPFITRHATDTIVEAVAGDGDPSGAVSTILWLSCALLAAELSATVIRNVGGYVGDVMAARMRHILSTRYFAKLLSLPQRFFDTQITGTLIARLDRSITSISQFLQTASNNFFPMLITIAAVLGITAWYYWPLAVLLIIIFPVYMWLTALTSKKWQVWEAEKNHHVDLAGGRFAEVIGQVKVVKSFVSEVRELREFARHFVSTVVTTSRQSRYWHWMDVARGAAMNVVFFGIYLLLFYRTLLGHFTLGEMIMLIQLVAMIRQPVTMMSYLVDTTQRAIAGSKDYFAVMESIPEPSANSLLLDAASNPILPAAVSAPTAEVTVDDAPAALRPVADEHYAIRLRNVSFGYDEDEEVIHDVSLSVAPGQRIALVGESGGGKSTLVNLLLGLYTPDSGEIWIGGHDTRTVSATQLRASVGVVFQEPALFSGTIRDNIAYGRPSATDEEIEEVARRANAHGFISRFPDGYDTVIGERGLRLSGGQKQRVAVARAMLKDAPLLLLDEATSALDTKAERAVQAGLDQLMEGRTTVIIAHRLSTIASVDTIITLKDGRIDEVGTPAELARSGGIYAELLALTASTSKEDRKRLQAYDLHG